MSFLKETRFIERLQFFNGQRLFASDLQGLEAFNREMRWLHNKSLHQPGIGSGLAASGKKGDREVRIGPGYAIDAEGREIVLNREQVEPVPPVAGDGEGNPALYDLTVSYPSELEEAETREGICLPRGTIRVREEPVFCWVRLSEQGQPLDNAIKQEILAGMRIVLCRVEVFDCELYRDISIAQRVSARPPKQPFICCLEATPDWRPWIVAPIDLANITTSDTAQPLFAAVSRAPGVFPIILPIGLKADIDTSACGFLTTPCYWARISGPRVKSITREVPSGDTETPRAVTSTFIIDGLIQISNSSSTGFRINVLLMAQFLMTPADVFEPRPGLNLAIGEEGGDIEDAARRLIAELFSDWQVVWMGVEG